MLVIRLYEAWGREVSTEITFDFEPRELYELNSIEHRQEEIPVEGQKVKLSFDAFEIKTIGIVLS